MNLFLTYQSEVLKILGCICILLTFFSGFLKFQSIRKKIALILVEFGAGVLLISDCFSYIYEGSNSVFGYYAIRISNFFLFFLVACVYFGFHIYLISLYTGRGKRKTTPRRLKLAGFLIAVETVGVLLTPFLGLYYSIDGDNIYHRGPLFLFSYVLFFTAFFLQLTVIIQYYNLIGKALFASILLFACLPFVAGFIQWFIYGISALNIGIGISAIVLFVFYLWDQNEYLIRAANSEVMTGLPNTYGFLAEAEKRVLTRTISHYDIIYFDMVKMGRINRRYGSDIGDLAIIQYAKTIESYMEVDEMLARLGGNFFIAMVQRDRAEGFLKFIGDVEIEVYVDKAPVILHISAVAGCFAVPENHTDIESIVGFPAIALNLAKYVQKKPYLYYSDEMQMQMNRSRVIEDRIPKGLQDEEFYTCYQPKINTNTKTLCGVEALGRWKRAGETSTMYPDEFIPIMENSDLVCEFDFYMLDHVCRDISNWISNGMLPPVVSLNLSRRNLSNPHIVEDILQVLKKYNIKPEYMQIEWKEAVDEYPIEVLKNVVLELKRVGFSVAIDDFAATNSTIQILRDIPFDVIKVDQNYIDYSSEKDIKILKLMIDVIRSMGAEMVAECVESREQLDTLTILGCHLIQGFIFSKPLDKEEFLELMKKGIE